MKGNENELQAHSKLSAFGSPSPDDSRQPWNRNSERDTKCEPPHTAVLSSQEKCEMLLSLLIKICIEQSQNTSLFNTFGKLHMLIEQGIW